MRVAVLYAPTLPITAHKIARITRFYFARIVAEAYFSHIISDNTANMVLTAYTACIISIKNIRFIAARNAANIQRTGNLRAAAADRHSALIPSNYTSRIVLAVYAALAAALNHCTRIISDNTAHKIYGTRYTGMDRNTSIKLAITDCTKTAAGNAAADTKYDTFFIHPHTNFRLKKCAVMI